MTKSRVSTIKGACVVALTKRVMKRLQLSPEEAYRKLLETEIYALLMDEETGLYLEPNSFLCRCYDTEMDLGADALYKMIDE